MKRFEYEITRHFAKTFGKMVYFCNETGDCGLDEVPDGETDMFTKILNDRGSQGWELIQFTTGKEGLMAFWKRHIVE